MRSSPVEFEDPLPDLKQLTSQHGLSLHSALNHQGQLKELLKRRGTQFVVVSAAEPDALREASFFVDRLAGEHMPLAGLILNRTHPTLCNLHADKAAEAADELEKSGSDGLTGAVLRIHAARASTAKREVRLLSRFTGANPHVAIVGVPSLPFDVSDLEALRAIADQITGELPAA